MWSFQLEWTVLPTKAEHKQVQWYQVVLLEGVRLLAQGHSHDDPASRFLNACLHYQKNLLHPKINSKALRDTDAQEPLPTSGGAPGVGEDLCVPD